MTYYNELYKAYEKTDDLLKANVTENDTALLNWTHDVFQYLIAEYGENSDEVKEFNEIEFTSEIFYSKNDSFKNESIKDCKKGLEKAQKFMKRILNITQK